MKPHCFFRASLALFSLLTIHLFHVSDSRAQSPDTLKAAVPYSVFPIGGMRGTPTDTLQAMIGANFNWDGFQPAATLGTIKTEGGLVDTILTYPDPFHYDTTTAHSITQDAFGWTDPKVESTTDPGYLLDAACGIDVRAFMPGTSGLTQEYNYAWDTTRGIFADTNHAEWVFNVDSKMTSGQYVLCNRHGAGSGNNPMMTDPFAYVGYATTELDPNHIGSTSYESVFFFKNTDLLGVSDTTTLYKIEYWSLGNGDSALLATDVITKNLWNSLPVNSASTEVPGRNVGAENFTPWHNHVYKLLRRNLNTRPLWKNNFTSPPVVDVRIRTFKQIPMYFRLLRIRDWRAQRLLTGRADSVLNLAIAGLLAKGDNAQKASWTLGNEFSPLRFHAWSYVNDLFAKNHAPRANILTPYSPDLFIRVMRDQSQYKVPAHLWYEWTPFGGDPWYEVDTLPNSSTLRKWSYSAEYSAYPSPIPSDVAPDSVAMARRDIFVQSNYDKYTSDWQELIIGHPSEAIGGGVGFEKDFLKNSRSCYETDPLNPVPFTMMAPAIASIYRAPKWSVDSMYWIRKDILKMDDPQNQHMTDLIYMAQIIRPYLQRNPGQWHIPEDSLFDIGYGWRPPTSSEFYYSLWMSVAHGVKGYAYNYASDDGIAQDGFLWDSASGHILKSSERTCIEQQPYCIYSPYIDGFSKGQGVMSPLAIFNHQLKRVDLECLSKPIDI
jgi:hypothetical protein